MCCTFFTITANTTLDNQQSNGIMESAIDDDNHGVTSILTPKEIMKIGLKLVGFKRQRIRRARRKTNVKQFKTFFGAWG
jgi:hypothetical protein